MRRVSDSDLIDFFVERHASRSAEKIALECESETVRYGELAQRVRALANGFERELSIRPGDRVALLLNDTPSCAYCFFAALAVGAVPALLNVNWDVQNTLAALQQSGAKILIAEAGLLEQPGWELVRSTPSLERVLAPTRAGQAVRSLTDVFGDASRRPDSRVSDDRPGLTLFTSGSTGRPKAITHARSHLRACTESFAHGVLNMSAADKVFSVARLHFAYGLGAALYMPLACGATSVLTPSKPTVDTIFRVIRERRPTLFFSVPSGFVMMLNYERAVAHRDTAGPEARCDLSSLRVAISAGEPLPRQVLARFTSRFGVDILDGLGATETLHTVLSNRPGNIRAGSCGYAVPGYQVRVVDSSGKSVAPGVSGVLQVRGPSIYVNGTTAAEAGAGEWLSLRDRCRRDADGFYWFEGREDDLFKVNGRWLSPVRVEQIISEHELVKECAVLGMPDAVGLIKPIGAIVWVGEDVQHEVAVADLRRYLMTALESYERPRGFVRLSSLPRTSNGKLLRHVLRQQLSSGAASVGARTS